MPDRRHESPPVQQMAVITYAFTLRKGIRYSNGSPVRASDFKRRRRARAASSNGNPSDNSLASSARNSASAARGSHAT